MYNIIGTRKIWFVFSFILIAFSVFFLMRGGLKLGIDFTGGSLLKITFKDERPDASAIQSSLQILNLGEILVQPVREKEVIIRMKDVSNETRQKILDQLTTDYGTVSENSFETIGPTIGKELKKRAVIAIVIVMVAIILYISWAFRKISAGRAPSYLFGMGAIIALAHDILIVTGIFAVLGFYLNVEIGTLFVTALLTILGFSVHDTIVVYDRIREGLIQSHDQNFEEIINNAINHTLIRSLNTSITTLFVLIALYLFGGESIKYFVLALIFGIILGTYSSIFIASPLLLLGKRLFSHKGS